MAACILQSIEEAAEGQDQNGDGIRGNAWFGSYKAAVFEDTLNDAPGGIWIVLQSTYQGILLVAIGYHYSNTCTTLCFVATKDAGSITKGKPYQMKYSNDWGNIHINDVDRPDIISKFFESSNMIDKHNNQTHQEELALKKHWLTQNPYFHLHTTLLGINVVDCYKLEEHNNIINHRLPDKDYKMTMTCFAGILAHPLIKIFDSLHYQLIGLSCLCGC
jgi:hypothetical protein